MYIFCFFFNRFAIIWIPLVLLVIFNTILIFYVHRSKQNELRNSDGIKLRRHNRGSQGEQRKTTIMLSKFVQRKILYPKSSDFSCSCYCIYCLSNSSSHIFNRSIIFSYFISNTQSSYL